MDPFNMNFRENPITPNPTREDPITEDRKEDPKENCITEDFKEDPIAEDPNEGLITEDPITEDLKKILSMMTLKKTLPLKT